MSVATKSAGSLNIAAERFPQNHRGGVSPLIYLTQSSSFSPGTRSNSLTLLLTRIAPVDTACPAIPVSFGPMGG